MTNLVQSSRRRFLKSTAALGAGLVVGFVLPPAGGRWAVAQEAKKAPIPPNAFVRIAKDGSVTIVVKHLEFGQGVNTSLPMILAEELECDWSQVRWELAPAAPEYAHTAFGMQMTGGSSSVWNSWDQLRIAGAQARTMLVQAAANQWKVKPEACHAEKGNVIGPGGKRASYGQLAEAASKLPVPDKVELKDRAAFKRIGTSTRRLDAADKANGKATFGMDVKRKDLHTAVVLHAPVFGAGVASFNADKVKGVQGVTHVVEVTHGVAVVATNFWSAKKGRDALEVQWDLGPNAKNSTEAIGAKLRAAMATPGAVAHKAENAEAMKGAARTLTAEYEVPFLAHAPMEPQNCTVELRGDSAEIWVGSQFQSMDQMAAAKMLELPPEKVRLNTMLAGGGFGRRATPTSDYVVEACEIAKNAKVPVKLVWTREDDIRGGLYRPAYVHKLEAGLDAQGQLVAWHHRIVGQSIMAGTSFAQRAVKDGDDRTSVEGAANLPYAIPNLAVELTTTESPVPVLWWRVVGSSHTAYAVEAFIDEVAEAAGQDPYRFRRALLAGQPRHRAVLDLAAEKAGWGQPLPKGRGRGIAVAEAFHTYVAQVAEVTVGGDGKVKVDRVICAVDCGVAVNPDVIAAQMEGGIGFGLGAALYGAITLKDGQVEQSNFDGYQVLRIDDMPKVEVHIVPSTEAPTGVGEPGVAPIGPAVANAVFAATGKRYRVLPFSSARTT